MKSILFASLLFLGIGVYAQIPENFLIEDLQGKKVSLNELRSSETPVVLSFWATWCKPCIRELNTIDEYYQDWQEEYGVTLYAISIDDTRQKAKLPGYVAAKGWEYTVYSDYNAELQRAMGVVNIPHTFLIHKGEIVWQHNSYSPGDELELEEQIADLIEK